MKLSMRTGKVRAAVLLVLLLLVEQSDLLSVVAVLWLGMMGALPNDDLPLVPLDTRSRTAVPYCLLT
jgi:hypothetical protein